MLGFEVLPYAFHTPLELPDGLAKPPGKLGKLPGSEKEEGHHEDGDDLRRAIDHALNLAPQPEGRLKPT